MSSTFRAINAGLKGIFTNRMNVRDILLSVFDPMTLARIRRRWRKIGPRVRRALLCVSVTVGHGALFVTPLGQAIEGQARDTWFALRGQRPASEHITIVRVDVPTYRMVGISPSERLPRDILAKAIRRISSDGPKLIILDFLLEAESESKTADLDLAETLAATNTWVARTWEVLMDTDAKGQQTARQVIKDPIPLFAEKAKGSVFLMSTLSSRGLVEELELRDFKTRQIMPPPLKLPLQQAFGDSVGTPEERSLINFFGAPGSLTSLSLADLLSDQPLDPAYFRNRVVFIGMMVDARVGLTQFYDVHRVAFGHSSMWGVEIQATIAANLIEKNWVRRADFPLEAGALSTLAFCATFLLATVSIALASALVVAIAALWSIAVFYLFVAFNCSIPGATLFFVLLPLAVALRVLSYSLVKWREARRFRIQRAA